MTDRLSAGKKLVISSWKKKLYYKNCWLLAFFSPFKKERNLTTLPLSSISSSSSNTKSCHKSQYEIGENNSVSCLLSVRSWKLRSLGLHFLLDSSGAKELLLSALLSKKYLRRRLYGSVTCLASGKVLQDEVSGHRCVHQAGDLFFARDSATSQCVQHNDQTFQKR